MISARHGNLVSHTLNPALHALYALGCFLARADLVVIEKVLVADVGGGKVRHDNVGSGEESLLATLGVDSPECRRCGQQHIREDESDHRQKPQGKRHAPGLEVCELRVVMRYEGSDPDHLRLEIDQETQVLHKVARLLVGRPYHHPASDLITDLLEDLQAIHPVLERHPGGMKLLVMLLVGCLVAQEVPVGTRPEHDLVLFPLHLADRQGHCAIAVFFLDNAYDVGHDLRRKVPILTALENDGSEPELVARVGARKDLLLGEPVAVEVLVIATDPAVIAVVPADV